MSFSLDQVTVLSANTIRVHFTSTPKASSVTGANDATNLANYSLSALASKILKIATVDGDVQSFDLSLTVPLVNGTWTVTAVNLQTPLGDSIVSAAVPFSYNSNTFVVPAGGGATNLGSESFFKRHLGKAFIGKAFNALAAAVSAGDTTNWNNAQLAFEQKFKISASGKYLDRKMSDSGIVRPASLGMSDDIFRRYGIKLSSKLTTGSVRDMLEVFYGSDAVRAFSISGLAEPYAISTGDDLQLLLDEKSAVSIIFDNNDFVTPGVASAIEVATAITRYLRQNNSTAYAVVYKNQTTGLNYVKLYSASSGLGSALRITGGKTQNVLQFGSLLTATTSGTVGPWLPKWTVTQPTPGTSRFTTAGAINLYTSTEDLTGSTWIGSLAPGTNAILTKNAVPSPIGTPAQSVQVTSGNFVFADQTIIANGGQYTFSAWVRSLTGTQTIAFIIFDFTTQTTISTQAFNYTATTTWQRIVVSCPNTTSGHNIGGLWYPASNGVGLTGTSCAWGFQLEQGASVSNYVPSYDTTPRAVTNLLYWSEAFTNPAWTLFSTGTVITDNAQTDPKSGVGGASSTAASYVTDGTHGGVLAQEFFANGGAYTGSVWIKAISPSTISFALGIWDEIQQKYISLTGLGGFGTQGYTATATWTRVTVNAPTSVAGNRCGLYLYNNSFTATLAIWGAMLEANSSLAGPYVSSNAARGVLGMAGSGVDLTQVKPGDYANIYSTFNANNRGSLPITNVSIATINSLYTQSFDVATSTFTGETVQQAAAANLLLFRPTKNTTFNIIGAVSVNATPTGLNISIPATTLSVARAKYSGAYLQGQSAVTATSMIRNAAGVITVTTPSAHGLSVGQQVIIDGAYASGLVTPAVNAGSSTTTSASVRSLWSSLTAPNAQTLEFQRVALLSDGLSAVIAMSNADGATTMKWQKFAITGSTILADGSTQYTYSYTLLATATSFIAFELVVLPKNVAFGAGKVLRIGGNPLSGPDGSTTFIDPATGTQTSGPNTVSRAELTATLLNNNKILITGGYSNPVTTTLGSTDIYDPNTGIRTVGPAMSTTRRGHKAVTLNNGKVLIIGGRTSNTFTSYTPTCEIYDPVLNSFAPTGALGVARSNFAAITLPDGRVLVAGGETTAGLPTKVVEIYDATGTWSVVGNLSVNYGYSQDGSGPSASYIPSKNVVLILGNNVGGSGTTAFDIFDVTKGRLVTPIVALTIGRPECSSVTFSNNAVLLAGGNRANAELFIPGSDSYSSGKMNGVYQIASVPTGTTFTVQSQPGSAIAGAGATYTPMASVASTTMAGPYIFEPKSGVAITTLASTTTGSSLLANKRSNTVSLSSSPGFVDAPSQIMIGYGTSLQQGPINVLGIQNGSTLLIDPTFTFGQTIPNGTSVIGLFSVGGYTPANPQSVGSFYLTASGAGRQAASLAIDSITAGGIPLTKNVLFPGDRGLGNEGRPTSGVAKMSDAVRIFGSDGLDSEIKTIGGGI